MYIHVQAHVMSYTYIRESCGYKSSVGGSDDETRDEQTARYAGSVGPTGKYEVDQKHDPQCRESEGT